MFLMNFFISGKSKEILVVYWTHLGKEIWQTFRSQFSVFAGSVGIKSFAKQVLESFSGRKNFLEPPVFGFTNILPFILKVSRKLRMLIIWVLH